MRFPAFWVIASLAWDSVTGLPTGGSPPPSPHPHRDRIYTATLDANVIWSGTPLANPNNRRSLRDFALGAGTVLVVTAGRHYYVNNLREKPWSGTPLDLENNPNDSLEPFLEKHRKLLECIGERTALKPGLHVMEVGTFNFFVELCRGDRSLINKDFQGVVVVHLPPPRLSQQPPAAQPRGSVWNWRSMGNWRNIFIAPSHENNANDKLGLGDAAGDGGEDEKRRNDERKEGNEDVREFSAGLREEEVGQKSSASLVSPLAAPRVASPTATVPELARQAQQRMAQAAHQAKQVLGSLPGLLQTGRLPFASSPSSSSSSSSVLSSPPQPSLFDGVVSYVKLRSASSSSSPSLLGLSLGSRGSGGGQVGQRFSILPSAAPAGGLVMPRGR